MSILTISTKYFNPTNILYKGYIYILFVNFCLGSSPIGLDTKSKLSPRFALAECGCIVGLLKEKLCLAADGGVVGLEDFSKEKLS
jgi:hypothetical protein